MCIGFRVGHDESQHPRLHFPGQPGVAQRAQALVTPHLPQRLSATEGVDWLALKAAGAEIATGTGTVSLRQGNCAAFLEEVRSARICRESALPCPSLLDPLHPLHLSFRSGFPTLGLTMGGQWWRPPPSTELCAANATLDGVHQARCNGARLIGLVRKDASVWLEAVAAVAEEAAVAAMQAFSAEQPLPQQPVPVFPGYNSRPRRSLEQMQEHARLHLTGSRSLEQMQEHARLHLPGSRSLQSMQESARLHLNDHRSLEEMQASMHRACMRRAPK
jgi:hypothetical protein